MLIIDFISTFRPTRRLSNVLRAYSGTKAFPFVTTQDCKANLKECLDTFHQLPNVGAKTKREFAELIRISDDSSLEESDDDLALVDISFHSLGDRNENDTISVRLRNVLINNASKLSFRTLREGSEKAKQAVEELASCRGVGKTTIKEFLNLSKQIAIKIAPMPETDCVWSAHVIGDCKMIMPCPAISRKLTSIENALLSKTIGFCTIVGELIQELDHNLNQKETAAIIEMSFREYGIDRNSPIHHLRSSDSIIGHCDLVFKQLVIRSGYNSLDSILEQVQIVLDDCLEGQASQIQDSGFQNKGPEIEDRDANAVAMSQSAMLYAGLLYAPSIMHNYIKRSIMESFQLGSVITIASFQKKVDKRLSLLLQCTYGNIARGLDRFLTKVGKAWVDENNASLIEHRLMEITSYLKTTTTPTLLSNVMKNVSLDMSDVLRCIEALDKFVLVDNFIVPQSAKVASYGKDLVSLMAKTPAINPVLCSFLPNRKAAILRKIIYPDDSILNLQINLTFGKTRNLHKYSDLDWLSVALDKTLTHLKTNAIPFHINDGSTKIAFQSIFANRIRNLQKHFRQALISILGKDRIQIAKDRFGAPKSSAKTLDQLATELSLTKERIRQLENRILKTYRDNGYKDFFKAFFEKTIFKLSSSFSHNCPLMSLDRLNAIDLPWELLALIRCEYGSEKNLMNQAFPSINGYWYLGELPMDKLSEMQKIVDESSNQYRFPIELATLSFLLCLSLDQLRFAVKISYHLQMEGNLVFRSFDSTNYSKRKSYEIYSCLKKGISSYFHKRPIQIANEIYHYGTMYSPSDVQGFLRKMEPAVINLFDSQWTIARVLDDVLDQQLPTPQSLAKMQLSLGDSEKELYNLLSRNGPMHLSEVQETVINSTVMKFDHISTGPIMLASPYFVAVLPGVYGTIHQIFDDKRDELAAKFSHDRFQIEMYIYAMKCGADVLTPFPFWTHSFALNAANWLREIEDHGLLDNLISVCKVEQWNVSSNIKNFWHNYKENRASMTLARPPENLETLRLPNMKNLVATLILCEKYGFIGWIACNRVMRQRSDSNAGALLLAILVGLGVIDPANTWQDRHFATEKVRHFRLKTYGKYLSQETCKKVNILNEIGIEKPFFKCGGWVTPQIRDFLWKRLDEEHIV